jgi:hypothetical protein
VVVGAQRGAQRRAVGQLDDDAGGVGVLAGRQVAAGGDTGHVVQQLQATFELGLAQRLAGRQPVADDALRQRGVHPAAWPAGPHLQAIGAVEAARHHPDGDQAVGHVLRRQQRACLRVALGSVLRGDAREHSAQRIQAQLTTLGRGQQALR